MASVQPMSLQQRASEQPNDEEQQLEAWNELGFPSKYFKYSLSLCLGFRSQIFQIFLEFLWVSEWLQWIGLRSWL